MMRMAMSPAASGLLRELVRCAGCGRDRILLTELRSVLIPLGHVQCLGVRVGFSLFGTWPDGLHKGV